MTLELAPDLAAAIAAAAARLNRPADELAAEALRERFTPRPLHASHEEFVRGLNALGRPRTVVLTDQQLSREELYE